MGARPSASSARRLRRSVECCCLGIVLSCGGCQAVVGDYTLEGEAEPSGPGVRSAAELCDAEREHFTFEIDLDTDERLADLGAYYERANPDLVDHLRSIAEQHQDGLEHSGVTYLSGAAGVGKSFVMRNILDAFTEAEQCSVEVAPLFTENTASLGFAVELSPDLASVDGEHVFNELPNVAEPAEFDLEAMLSAGGCLANGQLPPLVVIDGIDELHADAAELILREVDRFALDMGSNRGPFLHFLVSARPEGFADWLTAAERTEGSAEILDRFTLASPRYETAGDLAFRLEGYLDFTGTLATHEDAGTLDEYFESFRDAVVEHPFLTYSIGNLAVGNIVIDNTAPGLDLSEAELKAGLFDDMLVRNADTHGRPGSDGALQRTYRRLLEDVAATYVETNADGTFIVRSDDRISAFADDGSPMGEVRVRTLLNRSGVALLTSPMGSTTRYQFDPFWLHAHLIERRNQRIDDDYTYEGCAAPDD